MTKRRLGFRTGCDDDEWSLPSPTLGSVSQLTDNGQDEAREWEYDCDRVTEPGLARHLSSRASEGYELEALLKVADHAGGAVVVLVVMRRPKR